MSGPRSPRVLRWLAALLVRGPDALFIRADLDDAWERDLARGLSSWRAHRRYVANVAGSSWSIWRSRWRLPDLGISRLDVKLGVRMLAKQPGLTVVSMVALAIGIPVGLAPMHAALALDTPPPVEQGDRIKVLKPYDVANSRWARTSLYDFAQWRESLTTFGTLGATTRGMSHNIGTEDGRAAPVRSAELTASSFEILRVKALLGRTLEAADEVAGAPRVVVISRDLWQSRLAGDAAVLGRTLRVDGVPHEIVGVMPAGFHFPVGDQLWLPLRSDATTDDHAVLSPVIFGRLSDGVSMDDAAAELAIVGGRMAANQPELHEHLRLEVVDFTTGLFGLPKGGLSGIVEFYFFQALALLVLVVACVNIGMLFLARTAARSGEVAVRTALGASRTRVISQLFTESLVLAVLAAGTGLLVADIVANRAFTWLTDVVPNWIDLGVTPRTVLFAMILAVFSAAIVGVIPAIRVTGRSVQRNIQRAAAHRSGVRFGGLSSALIVVDVTLAVATLALAIATANGLSQTTDGLGIQADRYLAATATFSLDEDAAARDPDQAGFLTRVGAAQQELVRRLSEQPDVQAVAVADALPGMIHSSSRIEIEGDPAAEEFRGHQVRTAHVDIGYFEALGQPILGGRGFDTRDLLANAHTVIVNTSFVENVLGGRNPLGRRVRYVASSGQEPGPWYEIVGLVDHLGMLTIVADRDDGMYFPMPPGGFAENARTGAAIRGRNQLRFAIRTDADAASFTARLREIANEVDASILIGGAQRLDEVFNIDEYTFDWIRLGAVALVIILLGMSVSGTYALMAFTVSQRTREIGIRTALGERPGRLALTIARRALVQIGIGVTLGMLMAAFLLADLNSEAHRPIAWIALVTLLVGTGVMVVTGLAACAVPTLRALRIMPTEALRSGS